MTKTQAYAWLRELLGLSASEAHIGRFSAKRCQVLVERVQEAEAERRRAESETRAVGGDA